MPSASTSLLRASTRTLALASGSAVAIELDPPLAGVPVVNEVKLVRGPCRFGAWGLAVRDAGPEQRPSIRVGGAYSAGCGEQSTMVAVLNHRQFIQGFFLGAWQAAGGSGDLASLAGTGLRLDTGGAGAIEVRESGNGTVAADLGILRSDAGGVIVGDNLHARLTGTTPVEALKGGAGVTPGPIRITNGALSAVVDLSSARTLQDILNAINTAGVGAKAVINGSATGIDVINLVSGTEMRVTEQGGSTADALGILSLHATGLLSDLNHGKGVRATAGGPDFRITSRDGTTVDVSVSGAVTVQDVLDAINHAAAAAGASIQAVLNPTGPGIRIDDTSGGTGILSVERLNSSFAIDDLGLNRRANAGENFLIGDDVAGVRADSVFSALMDLESGLRRNDTAAINQAAQELEAFAPELARLRGIVGARSQAMHNRVAFTEDAVQATKALLSEVKDLDYTEAITRFQQAQTTLQANLMTGSRLLQLSLLDFIG